MRGEEEGGGGQGMGRGRKKRNTEAVDKRKEQLCPDSMRLMVLPIPPRPLGLWGWRDTHILCPASRFYQGAHIRPQLGVLWICVKGQGTQDSSKRLQRQGREPSRDPEITTLILTPIQAWVS